MCMCVCMCVCVLCVCVVFVCVCVSLAGRIPSNVNTTFFMRKFFSPNAKAFLSF